MEKDYISSGSSSNFLVDKPLDFHDATFSVSPSLFKVKKAVEALSKVAFHHY